MTNFGDFSPKREGNGSKATKKAKNKTPQRRGLHPHIPPKAPLAAPKWKKLPQGMKVVIFFPWLHFLSIRISIQFSFFLFHHFNSHPQRPASSLLRLAYPLLVLETCPLTLVQACLLYATLSIPCVQLWSIHKQVQRRVKQTKQAS